ncbi:MAG TPA: glycoside hydrolase family 140 protein [Chitinophagaceae bacterium]|nr:glycoside hydrolase family 140 protein [Chitinophagaceae bacterium]
MRKIIGCLFLSALLTPAFAQFSVSTNHRYLLKDGKPFFWMGDTAWELFHRLDSNEANAYLKKRSEQGFTVVQAVVLAELDGLHTPNANGDLPLLNDDPTQPNEKYFSYVDFIIDKAASYDINIALLPTWGDKIFKDRWGKGPEIFNESNAAQYATWLAKRYANKSNIIWVLGGDRIPRGHQDLAVWRAMGKAIMAATNNKAVISFHPQPNQLGSAEWFLKDDWLSFTMFQTGHCRDAAVYDKIQAVYHLPVTKPVMDAEPIYEDHPVCFNANDLGTSNAFDVRRSAYLDLFSGAFGHTYGCHDVWQMNAPQHEAVNGPHYTWLQALDLPAATQMRYVRKLMEAFPMAERIPDQSIIVENNTVPAERIQATRGKDYLFVYSCAGRPFTVSLQKISGNTLQGFWYDPRNGKSTALEAIANKGSKKFTPPRAGYGQDWVLVLFDSSKTYKLAD